MKGELGSAFPLLSAPTYSQAIAYPSDHLIRGIGISTYPMPFLSQLDVALFHCPDAFGTHLRSRRVCFLHQAQARPFDPTGCLPDPCQRSRLTVPQTPAHRLDGTHSSVCSKRRNNTGSNPAVSYLLVWIILILEFMVHVVDVSRQPFSSLNKSFFDDKMEQVTYSCVRSHIRIKT